MAKHGQLNSVQATHQQRHCDGWLPQNPIMDYDEMRIPKKC